MDRDDRPDRMSNDAEKRQHITINILEQKNIANHHQLWPVNPRNWLRR